MARGEPGAEVLRRWEREQAQLRANVIEEDTEEWQKDSAFAGLERVGGVDLSYVKGNDTIACASLVVLSYPDLKVLYEDCQMVTVSAPYVAGFLAFREAPFLVEAAQRLQEREPGLRPQVLLIDGNGMLHHRGFGVACHLGVLTDLPCIGVAKNLLQVDGLAKDELHKEQIRDLQTGGDVFPLMGTSGRVLGMALRSCNKSKKPIYVSVGHRTCLESAVRLVLSCCRYRIPEPIRQAARSGGLPTDNRGACLSGLRGSGGEEQGAACPAGLTYDPESTSGSTCPPHRGMWLLSQGGRKRLSLSANLAPGRSCPEQT
ncbi:endonuclease V isoform X2 [Carettochelys insculpta]|uniref:endonuclease V isoform X2 n=1 Tax=Carettochelys insculpta TaxID=44489 RepID=UPI003EBFAE3F